MVDFRVSPSIIYSGKHKTPLSCCEQSPNRHWPQRSLAHPVARARIPDPGNGPQVFAYLHWINRSPHATNRQAFGVTSDHRILNCLKRARNAFAKLWSSSKVNLQAWGLGVSVKITLHTSWQFIEVVISYTMHILRTISFVCRICNYLI